MDVVAMKKKYGSYMYTILFTMAAAAVIIFKLKLYPFGDHYLRYMDGDQYYGFYGYLMSTFFSKSNLLYSWSMALGDNMVSTYAYYASSPFNLLLFFFRRNFLLGTQVISLLKIFLFLSVFVHC